MVIPSSKPRVAVFFGGQPGTRDLSQETGYWMCQYIPRSRYEVTPIHVTAQGDWQVPLGNLPEQGQVDRALSMLFKAVRPTSPRQGLERLLGRPVDAIMTSLRGHGGDDGSLHQVGQMVGIPVVGSPASTCHMTSNKSACHHLVENIVRGPSTAVYQQRLYPPEDVASLARTEFMPPFFVKPVNGEGSVGVEEIHSVDELLPALKRGLAYGDVLLQERLAGKEVSVSLMEDEDHQIHTLPPTVILPHNNTFYDYFAKRRAGRVTLHTTTITDDPSLKAAVEAAQSLYAVLGCQGLTSFDLMVTDDHEAHLLEVNTVPTINAFTPLQQQLNAANLHPSLLLDRLLHAHLPT